MTTQRDFLNFGLLNLNAEKTNKNNHTIYGARRIAERTRRQVFVWLRGRQFRFEHLPTICTVLRIRGMWSYNNRYSRSSALKFQIIRVIDAACFQWGQQDAVLHLFFDILSSSGSVMRFWDRSLKALGQGVFSSMQNKTRNYAPIRDTYGFLLEFWE